MRKPVIALLAAAVLVTIGALRVTDLRWYRDETLRTADERAANLSLILSEYLQEAFATGDAALRQIALYSRRVGGPSAPDAEWAPILASARAGLTTIGSISVIDASGVIRHSTRPEIIGQLRRDDALVKRALTAPGDDLLVGPPFRAIVEPFSMLIPLARKLTRADGSPEGVAVASFIPAQARGFFQNVDVGNRGALWVFHPDGIVLFREPSADDPLGQSAEDNPIFRLAVGAGASGRLRAALQPDGPMMLAAYDTGRAPGMIVAVALDRDEVLQEWRRQATVAIIVFAGLSLASVTLVLLLFRQMDAKAAAEAALIESRRLEAEQLRLVNQQLEATLAREQAARRDAENASALKDQFLMTVSHELRTPLTSIAGWARLLVDGLVSDRRRDDALRTIERNAYAQTRLIDDLLDVSRIMTGKLRLDVHRVDIAGVVQSAIETIGPAASAKSIRIETTIDPNAGAVTGDPERLQQIIWNLLSNAVKFTPKGGQVQLRVSRVDTDIELAVADSGVGISPEFLPHVFERFRQADGSTTRRHGGLGLGLAIARNLVELHGGSIAAHSGGSGRGAEFRVRLPASAVALERPASSTERAVIDEPVQAGTASRLDDLRVLVVDDDREACELFATVLEGAGALVSCVSSANEALITMRQASFDVIVTDIEMPGIDGYELLRQAQTIAEARGERLAAIAVTAYSRPEDAARSLEAGFARHVIKPVQPSRLIATVLEVARPAVHSDGPALRALGERERAEGRALGERERERSEGSPALPRVRPDE